MSKPPIPNKQNNTRKNVKLPTKIKNHERVCFSEIPNKDSSFFDQSQYPQRQGQEKLIQLTAQCAQYFERFTLQKDNHLEIISRAFSQVADRVQQAFTKIISQAQKKCIQIKLFLEKEHNRLIQQKRQQQNKLNKLLVEIKSVHLTRLECIDGFNLKQVLAEYAGTLDQFFNVMMEIEGSGCEDNIEQCINFINNLVRQQLKSLLQNKFSRIDDIFPLGTQQCFTFQLQKNHINDETVSMLQPEPSKQNTNQSNVYEQLQSIKLNQSTREGHISHYRSLIINSNPFRAIRLQ